MKKFFATLTIVLLVAPFSNALEVAAGKIKLILHEDSGRISLFSTEEPPNGEYTSLLLQHDPRTSGLNLLVDNEKVDPGMSHSFTQNIFRTDFGAKFLWTSKTLIVEENFYIIKSLNSQIFDGVQIEIIIKNISDKPMNIGLRYIFDTWLGEKNNYHFYTADGLKIRSEKRFTENIPAFWVSSESEEDQTGLLVALQGRGITTPNEVLFSNWKRINDVSWKINSVSKRDFDLQPFSINDSAVCQYYDPVLVYPGKIRYVSIIMGDPGTKGFENVSSDTSNSLEVNTSIPASEKKGRLSEIAKNELLLTEDLIRYINKILKEKRPLSKEEVNSLNIMINKLEKIKNDIDNN